MLNRSDFRGGRRRSRIGIGEGNASPVSLLSILVVLSIGLGILHNRLGEAGRPDPILAVASAPLVPAQRGAAHLQSAAFFSWEFLFGGKRVKDENVRLKAEVARLTQENEILHAKAAEADRLREAIGLRHRSPEIPLPAEVIAWLPFTSVDTITVARGLHDGVRAGSIVRTPSGLVGRVTEAGLLSAQTLLLTDVSSEVGALVRRGGKTQAIGIIQGTGRGQSLNLKHLLPDTDVKTGDKVYTSGFGDGVVPPDIPIGIIAEVTEDRAHFLKTARVTPLAPLPGDLREVYLLRSSPTLDIFAQRGLKPSSPAPLTSPSPSASVSTTVPTTPTPAPSGAVPAR